MLAIRRTPGWPLVIHVTPADGAGKSSGSPGGTDAIVWVIDPAVHDSFDPAPLQEIFGLTRSEARSCN